MFEKLAPNFHIKLADQDLPADIAANVLSVEFEDNAFKTDMAKVVIRNAELKLSNHNLFAEGNPLDIWMGYGNNLSYMGRLEIISPGDSFPRDDYPTLTITGYDAMHRMMDNSVDEVYEKIQDSRIIKKIAQKYNFVTAGSRESTITETQEPVIRTQNQKSDFTFVKEIADELGFEFFVEFDLQIKKNVLYFREPRDRKTRKFEFGYNDGDRTTLLDFFPKISTRGQKTIVEVRYYDKNKKEVSAEITRLNSRSIPKQSDLGFETKNGAETREQAFGESREVISDKPFSNEISARKFAEKWFKELLESYVQGDGHVIGLETLRAKQVHRFKGIGERLSGDYYFTMVRHVMTADKFYECGFHARKVI